MDTFPEWLLSKLDELKWKQADLVRESKLDSAVVSNIINGKRKVGKVTATAIAHALQLPPELVFEKAGLLPPTKTDLSPIKRAAIHAIETADDEDVDFINRWLNDRQEHKSAKLTLQPRAQK